MPTYEYYCPTCGYEKEVFQEMNDKSPTCPNKSKGYWCETEMKKRISKPFVIFKGDGFYETDYKKKIHSKPEKDSDKKVENKE